jgi:hypothetical protein
MRRPLGQGLGQHAGVLDHLLLVGLELGAQRFLEGHGLAGDDVHQRAALEAGKMAELMAFSCSAFIRMMPPRGRAGSCGWW